MMADQDSTVKKSAEFDYDEGDGGRRGVLRGRRRRAVISVVIVVFALLILLVADGVRRENKELQAVLEAFEGDVLVYKAGQEPGVSPEGPMTLETKDIIITGAGGTATIVFADGSAIQLEPNSRFTIETMAFARGGKRDRSFLVSYGSAVSRVSKFFGAESTSSVRTPTAVAAARGTGYRTRYHDPKRITQLQVGEGKVEYSCGGRKLICGAGYMLTSVGYRTGPIQKLTPDEQDRLLTTIGTLELYERPPGMLQKAEWRLTTILDPILRGLKIGPSGKPSGKPVSEDITAAIDKTVSDLTAQFQEEPQKPERKTLEEAFLPGSTGGALHGSSGFTGTRRIPDKLVNTWAGRMTSSEGGKAETPKKLIFEEVPGSPGGSPKPAPSPQTQEVVSVAGPGTEQPTEPVVTQVLGEGPIEATVSFEPTIGAIAAGAARNWLLPGILGAGAAAALVGQAGAGDGGTPVVPEPSSLLVVSTCVGLSGFTLRALRARRRR